MSTSPAPGLPPGPMTAPSVWAAYAGLPSGIPNPSAWYRILLPLSGLGQHGWDARCGIGHADPPPVSETAGTFILQTGDRAEAAAELARRGEFQRTVYEMDDEYFRLPEAITAEYGQYVSPDSRQSRVANIRACHVVTVTTEPLAESVRANTGHPDVRVIGNCVPDAVLDLPWRSWPGKTVIGWTGSGARAGDFRVALDAVRACWRRCRAPRCTSWAPTTGCCCPSGCPSGTPTRSRSASTGGPGSAGTISTSPWRRWLTTPLTGAGPR